MNTKLNKSDWTILAIVFGGTTVFNFIDYYREGNKLIEYLVDFPSAIILSIVIILVFIQVLVPNFLIKEKKYVHFIIFGILLLTLFGTLENLIGRFTAGKTLSGISNVMLYLQEGLYNGTDMVGFPLGILLIKKFYESQSEISKIEKQQKENELKLLRSQIDPHFLFNNLNTLDALIDSNPSIAKEYINRLSLIYRYLIKTKDAEVMELAKEVDFAENYMFLIETRFASDYDFEIINNTSLQDKFIPTGSLQIVLENVVKHNKVIDGNSIKTTISIEDDWITVTNSRSNSGSNSESLGTGLKNLKARYALLIDKQVQIMNTNTEFKISIPIIKLSNEN